MSMIHIASPNTNTTLTNLDKDCIQQNAVDLRIRAVFEILDNDFIIDEDRKVHRGARPLPTNQAGYWELTPGGYEFITDHIINMGPDEAGFVITRSTLNRNGVFITSGNYDSGYRGEMCGCLHVTTGRMLIKPGTRIGQFLLFKAEALSQYDGSYGYTTDGRPKLEQKKYVIKT